MAIIAVKTRAARKNETKYATILIALSFFIKVKSDFLAILYSIKFIISMNTKLDRIIAANLVYRVVLPINETMLEL